MGNELRLPNINAPTEREQLAQIKSYLYQLVPQLQWALNNIGSSSSNVIVQQRPAISPSNANAYGISTIDTDTPQASFESIKALIIKSAEIVDAYYEEISRRLGGVYVAQSDFGTYSEETEQSISETSTSIDRMFTNVQKIESDIEGIEYTLVEVNANTRSGLLYYNDGGVPIYGFEIGQRSIVDGEEVFNKYARFTSDRLSFYDQNDTEVAYISDYKLYIRNVEITSSYKIGGFVDTVQSNGDVVTRWVGGEG